MYAACFYPHVLFGFAPCSQGLLKEALDVVRACCEGYLEKLLLQPQDAVLHVHEFNLWEQ